jgi:hypothetical protein
MKRRVRYSILQVLIFVTLFCIACFLLRYSGEASVTLLRGVTLIALLISFVAATISSHCRRRFAIGFLGLAWSHLVFMSVCDSLGHPGIDNPTSLILRESWLAVRIPLHAPQTDPLTGVEVSDYAPVWEYYEANGIQIITLLLGFVGGISCVWLAPTDSGGEAAA